MSFIRRLIAADIPFARDDAHRLLPAMIACLVGFTALLLAVALSLSNALGDQSRTIIGTLQVEVPRGKNAETLVAAATAELKDTPGVEKVITLSTSQMETMLKPWLGPDFALADLPVPIILDVTTEVKDGKTAVDLPALRSRLARIDTGIRVDDRGPWVSQMVKATGWLQGVVLLVAVLLMLCVIGMIVLVARTNLRLHFKTVSLLHMFGATDEYILRQFQWNSAWLAARGAFAGVLFALFIFAGAILLLMRMGSPMLPDLSLSLPHGLMFVALPILMAMIALVATRLTVQGMLEHMH